MRLKVAALTLLGVSLLVAPPLAAAEVRVAVASNFTGPMQALAVEFERASGDHVLVTAGATGKLAAQIENGAPFEVLLAADDTTPGKLATAGLAVPSTRFTYAIGKLVLYSARAGYVDDHGAILQRASFAHLAIANPKLAPYGAAAMSVLSALHLLDSLRPKLVQGENIAQTFQFVASENAELGFVALSQIIVAGSFRSGSYWVVPETLYAPLRQDAIELQPGVKNPSALALLAFLRSDHARAIIASYGYGLDAAKPPRGAR